MFRYTFIAVVFTVFFHAALAEEEWEYDNPLLGSCKEHSDCAILTQFTNNDENACSVDLVFLFCPCSCKDHRTPPVDTNDWWKSYENASAIINATSCTSFTEIDYWKDKVCKPLLPQDVDDDLESKIVEVRSSLESGSIAEAMQTFIQMDNIPSQVDLTCEECQALCLTTFNETCNSIACGREGTSREGECHLSPVKTEDGLHWRRKDLDIFERRPINTCESWRDFLPNPCSCSPGRPNDENQVFTIGSYDCNYLGLTELPPAPKYPVEHFSLIDNLISVLGTDAFKSSEYYLVSTLDLRHNPLVELGYEVFKPLENLKTLYLSNTDLTVSGFSGSGRPFPSNNVLEHLDLSYTKIKSIRNNFFKQNKLTGLRRFYANHIDNLQFIGTSAFDSLDYINDHSNTDSVLEVGANTASSSSISTCAKQARTVFCQCATGYGPGYWKNESAADDDHIYGCVAQPETPAAPEILGEPEIHGNSAILLVNVSGSSDMSIAYLEITEYESSDSDNLTQTSTYVEHKPFCCESQEENMDRVPLEGSMLQIQNSCPPEGISCEDAVMNISVPFGTFVKVVLVTTNEARLTVRGNASVSVATPERPMIEVSAGEANKEAVWPYIVSAVFAATFLVYVIHAYVEYRRKMAPISAGVLTEMLQQSIEAGRIKQRKSSTPLRLPQEVNRSEIQTVSTLGKGVQGMVLKAYLKGSLCVAKVIDGDGKLEDLLSEAIICAQFFHENVVALKGIVTSGEPVMLMLEYCELGDLKSFLNKAKYNAGWQLSFQNMKRIMAHTARGMNHLGEVGFVHRDLAARNVLVTKDMVFKIADFGMGREMYATDEDEDSVYYRAENRRGLIPVRWCAPESLESKHYSVASDVWSWGVLGYEVFSYGDVPYSKYKSNLQIAELVKYSGLHPSRPDDAPEDFWNEIIEPCFKMIPKERPSFKSLVEWIDPDGALKEGEISNPYVTDLYVEKKPMIPADDTPYPDLYEYETGKLYEYEAGKTLSSAKQSTSSIISKISAFFFGENTNGGKDLKSQDTGYINNSLKQITVDPRSSHSSAHSSAELMQNDITTSSSGGGHLRGAKSSSYLPGNRPTARKEKRLPKSESDSLLPQSRNNSSYLEAE